MSANQNPKNVKALRRTDVTSDYTPIMHETIAAYPDANSAPPLLQPSSIMVTTNRDWLLKTNYP